MLPGLDGVEVCRRLRTFSDAYVLMLTARGEEIDRIMGLTVGADDYLVKPFSPREVVARIKALLRRPRAGAAGTAGAPGQPRGPVADAGVVPDGLEVDEGRRLVRVDGDPVELTALEFNLLALLAREPGIVVARTALLEGLWGAEYAGDDHLVDVHVANLRRKLGDEPASPRFVETIRGVGLPAARGRLMPRSLRARLLIAFLVVVVAAIGTVGVAVTLVGPGLLHRGDGPPAGRPDGRGDGRGDDGRVHGRHAPGAPRGDGHRGHHRGRPEPAGGGADRPAHRGPGGRRPARRGRRLPRARVARTSPASSASSPRRSTRWRARSRPRSAAGSSWWGTWRTSCARR